nr:unnamed protein product [Salmo salar]|eukprot:XP_014016079.1 PREDICTED: serine/threonine-protein phosphatase with EF-hands 2-like isoform X1 [Salmo salar]
MPQNGCVPSEVWGGGCSWGPDVTQGFLNRHNMQLISRSHGCKQDGYKFCHNRRCEVGCNRGAYMKLGPDLVPYLIQYQASSMTRTHPEEKHIKQGLLETMYHRATLETIFRIVDLDNSALWPSSLQGLSRWRASIRCGSC